MLAIPLWYLLVPYAVILLGTGIFLFFNLYHVAKFGVKALSTTALLAVYIIAYLGVLAFSAVLASSYDWTSAIPLSDLLPFLPESPRSL